MKIGVISDSHGNLYGVKKAIDNMGEVDMIIHLGDFYRDAKKVSEELNKDIIYVKGNCDFAYGVECDKIIQAENKKIFVTHGHNYNVKSDYMNLCYKAEEENVDIVLFGHTHYAEIFENNNIVFVNPGSLSRPRGASETYAVITLTSGRIEPYLCKLY